MKNNPAFPSHRSMGEVAHEGMTLRDYFAAKALQGLCANKDVTAPTYTGSQHTWIAETAYSLADAMIAERDK